MSSSKGVTLYTAATPNGHKISIALEEMGIPYTIKVLDMAKGETKAAEFVKINPNGRIPAIVDHDNGDLAVFESGAILLYLAEKYDKGLLLPTSDKGRHEVISWVMWQMSGQGPMQGQAGFFTHFFPVKQPKTVERFVREVERLYGVLNDQLANHEYIAADTFTIADIAIFPWANVMIMAGIDVLQFPHVGRWIERLLARPAVQRGLVNPESNYAMAKAILDDAKDPARYPIALKAIRDKQALTEHEEPVVKLF